MINLSSHGGCGEVVNTLDCGSNMHGFDSHHTSHECLLLTLGLVFLLER